MYDRGTRGPRKKSEKLFVWDFSKKYQDIVWDIQPGIPTQEVLVGRDDHTRRVSHDGESDIALGSKSPSPLTYVW